MLQTYTVNSNGVTLNTGDAISFNINDISNCSCIDHSAGTPTIEIKGKGYYQINFTSYGYNTGAVVDSTDFSGMYAFQLNNKNVPVVNTITAESSTSNTEIVSVGFSVLIYVPPSCNMINNNAVLTVDYLGQEGTLLGANLTVVKLA